MELVITPNEIKLLAEFDRSHPSLNVIREPLSVGDCIIRNKGDQTITCIVERKTMNDLWSSFNDGRYADQKRRLVDVKNSGNVHVVYIIEGTPFGFPSNKIRCIQSCIHSLQTLSGFIVHRTATLNETVETLNILMRFYETHVNPEYPTLATPIKVQSLKLRPNDLLTAQKWATHAIALVPQMSLKKAEALLETLGGFDKVLEALAEPSLEKVADTRIEGRRLGMKLAVKLKDYILTS